MTKKRELHEAIFVLEELERAAGNLEKIVLLKEAKDNEILKTLMHMSLGADNYYIRPKKVQSGSTRLKGVAAYNRFIRLTVKLKGREVTGNAARDAVASLLESSHPLLRKWFGRVLNHNLRIGVGYKTIDKVWRPESSNEEIIFKKNKCSLAYKYEDVIKGDKELDFGKYGYLSEPKIDGDRALLFVFPDEPRLVVLTRGAKRIIAIEKVKKYVQQLALVADAINNAADLEEGTPLFLDGEFIAKSGSWNETASIIRRTINFKESVFLSNIKTLLWDWAPLENFNRGIFEVSAKHRKFVLLRSAGLTKSTSKLIQVQPNIFVMGHKVVYNSEEMWADNRAKLDSNFEGSMLKNPTAPLEFKRTKNVLKLKPTDHATGTILECVPGKGKNAAAKKSHVVKVKKVMQQFGFVEDDGYYLHCTTKKSKDLVKVIKELIQDSNDRRVSQHLGERIVSYRYGARLGFFVVETEDSEIIHVGGAMTHKAGSDQRMEFWQRRNNLVGMKVEYAFQPGAIQVAKARFNQFHRLREDIS